MAHLPPGRREDGPGKGPHGDAPRPGCYWVGSLDFNFLVEIRLGFPLDRPTSYSLFAGGSSQQARAVCFVGEDGNLSIG